MLTFLLYIFQVPFSPSLFLLLPPIISLQKPNALFCRLFSPKNMLQIFLHIIKYG